MYAVAAPLYRQAGWDGVLPIPPRRKKSPPSGYTGEQGVWPSDEQVAAWVRQEADSNVALRLPPGVIGIDVDAYKAEGAKSFADMVKEWGELPPTWRSTSRDDGLSGIQLFRVPAGAKFQGAPRPGIEVVQFGHRYAMVAPSLHPEERAYRWELEGGPASNGHLIVPRIGDLPWLPDTWLEGLKAGAAKEKPTGGAQSRARPRPRGVRQVLADALARLEAGAGRHDAALEAVMALVRYQSLGRSGAAEALDELGAAFQKIVLDRSTPGEAAAEWQRLVDGAWAKIGSTDLPDEFWDSRDALRHIRQAAHARQRSAPAVLQAVLARVAAVSPHTYQLPPIVGSTAPLCYFAVGVAHSGVGKSSASAIATELLPVPTGRDVADQLPIGSGEGLAEVLFDIVEEPGANGKARKIKRQVRHNAYVYVDEGQLLGTIGNREGSSLTPTLRTIWSGGTIGQTNASTERKRIVKAGTYTFGVFVGLQPAKAAALLDDADGGTPQRFAWARATDPTIPDEPPEWPGRLEWSVPMPNTTDERIRLQLQGALDIAESIADEIRTLDLSRARGGEESDSLDGHSGLLQLKMAALLALLDGRMNVSEEDWALAATLKASSDAVRAWVVHSVITDKTKKITETRQRRAADAVAADEAVEARRIVDCARKIAVKVWAEADRWTVAELRRSLSQIQRLVFSDALAHAIAEGWVVDVAEEGQGQDKKAVRPGSSRPS